MFDKFKKYKFTDKKKSKGGIISSLLLVVALFLLGFSIYLSFKSEGNGGTEVGLLAMTSFVVALLGFGVAIRSFKEENVFFGYSWFGIVGNTIVWIILACLMLVGL